MKVSVAYRRYIDNYSYGILPRETLSLVYIFTSLICAFMSVCESVYVRALCVLEEIKFFQLTCYLVVAYISGLSWGVIPYHYYILGWNWMKLTYDILIS